MAAIDLRIQHLKARSKRMFCGMPEGMPHTNHISSRLKQGRTEVRPLPGLFYLTVTVTGAV